MPCSPDPHARFPPPLTSSLDDGSFYPRANYLCNDGVCRSDVQKLGSVVALTDSADRAWLWLFMTRNPGSGDWKDAIARFNQQHTSICLEPVNDPRDVPDAWFLGVAEVLRPH